MQTAYIIVEQDGGKRIQSTISPDDIASTLDGYYQIIKVEDGGIYFLVDIVGFRSPVWQKQAVCSI